MKGMQRPGLSAPSGVQPILKDIVCIWTPVSAHAQPSLQRYNRATSGPLA